MKKRRNRTHKLTDKQLAALIPTGPVNRHRAARDDIAIETRAESEGVALVTGQVVNTAVRKLLQQSQISLQEAEAAQLFRHDYDAAYASCISPLTSIQVDCSGNGRGAVEAMHVKVKHGERFRRALAHIGSELSRVVLASVIEIPVDNSQGTYRDIGIDVLPQSSKSEQQAAGKAVLVLALRELAIFYKLRNPNVTRIVLEG